MNISLPPVFDAVYLDTVDSVSAELQRRAAQDAEEGTLIWAGEQTDAKGQHGPWASPFGGLYCAVLLRPDFPPASWPEIGPVALLALGTAVAELLPPMTGLDFAWPNDVLVNGHKVGGISLHKASADALIITAQLNVVPPVEAWEYASLVADGAAETNPGEALERYARYLLDNLQRWNDEGIASIYRSLRARGLAGIERDGSLAPTHDFTPLSDFFAEVIQ
ncbi:MAG: biotin--[acetyl-CoA-carboxylase] ligase [Gammaproteobacteria bacterium]|nr:biotin--[acetyl-CoA-carboxylase] ligase [Gammaproteobacteria bacterium]